MSATSPYFLAAEPTGLLAQRRSIIVFAGGLFVTAVAVAAFSGYAEACGFQIPDENLQVDYLIGALWAVLLGGLIAAMPFNRFDKENLLIGWLAKCYVTLLFMLPYEQHYELDCFGYFWGMRFLNVLYFWDLSPEVRGRILVMYVGWIQERFFNSYHAVKVTFAMIGLISIYLVYRAAMEVIGRRSSDALLYFLLFPSILFWSSIIGKDPLVFLGVAMYVYGVVKWRSTGSIRFVPVLVAGIYLATFVRPWLGTILSIPMMYFFVRSARGYLTRVAFSVAAFFVLLFVFQQFADRWNVESTSELFSATDSVAHQFSRSETGARGSTRGTQTRFTSVATIIGFFPVGVFTVLFRPLPGEVRNVFGFISGAENVILLFWSVSAARTLVRVRLVRKVLRREPMIVWAVILVLTWCAMYGFVSFSNLGASVRFRLPIVAVFVGLLLSVKWVDAAIASMSARPAPQTPPLRPIPA